MKGNVSIYMYKDYESTLVYESENLVVDGAKTAVVDMLTFDRPVSSLSNLEDIVDPNNFTIAAMSLGPSRFDLDNRTETLTESVSGTNNKFPILAKPHDKTLQPVDTSNTFGHHLNYYEFSSQVEGINQLTDPSVYEPLLHFYGGYPKSDTSNANSRSFIDKNGFIHLNPDMLKNQTPPIDESTNGVIVSSVGTVSGIENQEVEYIFSLSQSDFEGLWDNFGGIDTLGLWVWDRKYNARYIGDPPYIPKGGAATGGSGGKHPTSLYNFEDVKAFPKFKLFAKRIVFPDGLQINETSYDWLTIKWKIRF